LHLEDKDGMSNIVSCTSQTANECLASIYVVTFPVMVVMLLNKLLLIQ